MFLASRCTIAIAALPNTPRVVPDARVTPMIFGIGADPQAAAVSQRRADEAGGTGERVAHEPLTGRVATGRMVSARSGPVGERATPTRYAVRGPCPWDRTRVARENELGDAAAFVRNVVDENVFAEMLRLHVEGAPIVYFRHLIDEVDEVMTAGEHEGIDRDAFARAADHLA